MKKESEMKEIKIIAVCPSPVILAGMASILSSTPDLRLLETLSDLSELSRKCISKSGADVVILDPAAVPAENLRSIRYSYDCIANSVLFAFLNAPYPDDVLSQFEGCVSVNHNAASIIKAVRAACTAHCHQEDSTDVTLSQEGSEGVLSPREKEIVTLVAEGYINKEIADKLGLSVFTVTTHRKNISQKLGIRSIAGLTVYAMMNGLVKK